MIDFLSWQWNTYGDPPNSDLLRRYGHVDLIPMAGGVEGNPADIVEIRADLVVDVLRMHSEQEGDDSFLERIDWWLEEGGDELSLNFIGHFLSGNAKEGLQCLHIRNIFPPSSGIRIPDQSLNNAKVSVGENAVQR